MCACNNCRENSMIFYSFGRLKPIALLLTSLLSSTSFAAISDAPVVGGLFNSAQILKNQMASSLSYSTRFARDSTLFTIAGVTLDSYILMLPLDAKTKARVIAQISNPTYAIPLGYFLYQYYDRYTGLENDDVFKQYLSTVYDAKVLKGFEHSLYHYGEEVVSEQKENIKDQGHHEGIKVDAQFIAAMVTVYDALVEIGEWQQLERLPDHYQYLTSSEPDRLLINKIQPIVIQIISQAANGMDEGEMKQALFGVLEDAKPENTARVNNKAEAITVTLIDFVRMNVLKGYRQFVYQQEREQALNSWLQKAFDDDPQALIAFLRSQQQRRMAVQITVDGLQQGLIEGLVDPSKPFIRKAHQDHHNRLSTKPSSMAVVQPEHQQQVRFMQILAEQPYHDPHYLPFFKRLYRDHRASITQVGISSTPTISVRNLPIIKTGAKVSGQGGTGIPNFHFVDRPTDRAYYFFGNDALQLDRLLVKNQVQTMFDRLAYLNTLNCNAQYDWNAHTTYDGLVNLGAGEALRDFGEKRCVRELKERAIVERELQQLRATLVEEVSRYQQISKWDFYTRWTRHQVLAHQLKQLAQKELKGMPDYTLIYNPWPDHFAHFSGPFSDEVIMPTGELNRLDYWLAQIEATYQDAGVYDRTLWGMAGDHGLAPVYFSLNPEKQIFDPLASQLGIKLKVKKISSDEGEGPKMTNAINAPSNKGIDVVVASTAGGNFMMDFFNAEAGWEVQPVYQELIRWQPIHSKPGQQVDVIDETVARLAESLDYLVVREKPCDLTDCSVRLVGERQGKRVDEWIEKKGDKLRYFAKSEQPLLLGVQQLNAYLSPPSSDELEHYAQLVERCVYHAKANQAETWCSSAQWRELTRFTPRPDSVNQLAAIYEDDRAGTINLFPKEGVGFNTKVPGRHAGESYLEKDAFIGFWGSPIGNQATPLGSVENGSLAPTLYHYLTGDEVKVGEDGWGYPSVLKQLDIR
ncbi:alkaline phosphatase family protein [Vibrio anguillarum]|uniref:alkaline phosphatase family protein n=1 Tax=Vibrio anguillarum TaxID=55601 RepID=UPI000BB473BF|nr:alkaline phosphatase family protein [Vibrio anguillarum]ATC59107.1 nucleotide pyrophosphatase [Vibrio anguillarum]MBF4252921.1 nucleotide pyrophosphatase [Vibrio anguillarum]MBF4404697.1 nucleotide pyrophosphatase [Vibrio anguillarum]